MAKACLKKLFWLGLAIIGVFLLAWLIFSLPVLVSAAEKQFRVHFHIECSTTLSRAAEIEHVLNEVLREDYPTITIDLKMELE